MQTTRVRDLDKREAELIRRIFALTRGKYADGKWHAFRSKMKYIDELFMVTCDFKIEKGVMSIGNRKIEKLDQSIVVH